MARDFSAPTVNLIVEVLYALFGRGSSVGRSLVLVVRHSNPCVVFLRKFSKSKQQSLKPRNNCFGTGHWVLSELETTHTHGACVDSGEKLLSGRVSQRGGKGTRPETQVDSQRSARCTNFIGTGHWVVPELETPLPLGAIVDSGE